MTKNNLAKNQKDVRWHQRLNHYHKALSQLTGGVQLSQSRKLSDLERQGLIKAFEFTYELAWNLMKDYFEFQGGSTITGSRDAIRESFSKGLIVDGDGWMEMLISRNQTSHIYNEETAQDVAKKVKSIYHPLLVSFEQKMLELKNDKIPRLLTTMPHFLCERAF